MVRAGEGSTPLSVHQRRCLRTAASASCALRQCCMPRTRDSEQAGCPLVATGAGRREVFVRSNRPARRGVLEVVLPSSFRRHLHLFVQTPRHQTLACRLSEVPAPLTTAPNLNHPAPFLWREARLLRLCPLGRHRQWIALVTSQPIAWRTLPKGLPLWNTFFAHVAGAHGATTAVRGGPEGHALAEH